MAGISQTGYSSTTSSITFKFSFTVSSTATSYRVRVYVNGSSVYSSSMTGSTSYSNVTATAYGLSSNTRYSGTGYLQYYNTSSGWLDSGYTCDVLGVTQAESVTGTITCSNPTVNGFTISATRSTSGASSVYAISNSTGTSTRLAYSSYSTAYTYTTTALSSGTTYTVVLYDATTSSGNVLDYTTITTLTNHTYYLTLYGNGGTWSGSTYISDYVTTTSTYYTFTLSSYTTPTYAGHSFLGWYDAQSGGTRVTTVTATTSSTSKSVWAYWSTNSYTISTSVSPSGAGTVSGGGSKYYGTSVSLTASANSGYEFNYWYDNDTGTTYSSNPYSFTCTGDRSLTAVFRSTTYSYTITYYPNGGTGSSITDTVTGSSSTFNTYLRGLTYTKAYNTQTGWHESDDTPHGLGDLISISHDMTLYATWTHDTTSYFYWFGNDTIDSQKIFTGTSITNLTAIAWKSIGTKINQVEALLGDTQTQFTTTMTSGSVFRATYYNEVTQALRRMVNNHDITLTYPVPSDTAKGNRLFYYLFNGMASVKACLNNIIQWYNSR